MVILSWVRRHRGTVWLLTVLIVMGVVLGVGVWRRQRDYRTFHGKTLCLVVKDKDSARQAAVFFDEAAQQAVLSCEEVRIPYRFNGVYDRYNALQEAFGTNLSDYCGRLCQQYRFRWEKNNGEESRTLTLLVCDRYLIGGDISDNDFDGEMRGLV